MNDKLQAYFSHILYVNKTHYKVSHFLPINRNPSPLPIATYLPVCPSASTPPTPPLLISPSDSAPSAFTPVTRPPFILPFRLRLLASTPPTPPPPHLPLRLGPSEGGVGG